MRQFTNAAELKTAINEMSDNERKDALLSFCEAIDGLAAALEIPMTALVTTAKMTSRKNLRKTLLERLFELRFAKEARAREEAE